MIHVWVVDEEGFYIEPTRKQEEDITEYDITTPLHTEFLCVKPKWNGTEWVEGATQEEIKEWKETFNKPSAPNEMEVLKARLNEIDMLIDDLVFEVIPSIEQQVQQGVEGVTLNNMISRGSEGMVGCLARKIIEGRDYRTVFKTNVYKQYQDEVDTILELEGHAHLIKRDELGVL